MRIVVDINHPVHVHLFKNFVKIMLKRGHDVMITASQKEASTKLLEAYKLDYKHLGSYGSTMICKLLNLPVMDVKMYKAMKDFSPDILIGFGSIRASHASRVLKKPYINFRTNENVLYAPFADVNLTASYFRNDIGVKQVKYDSYYELAYLHPHYFKPDPTVLEDLDINLGEIYTVLRFASWSASHDFGHKKIKDKRIFVNRFEDYGPVFISSEAKLDNELERYKLRTSPEKLLDVIAFASLCLGDGASTASEAAILGTPSIYISSTIPGHLYDEEANGLIYIFSDKSDGEIHAIRKGVEILSNNDSFRIAHAVCRDQMLREKIDINSFMVWFIENYPESYRIAKSDSMFQDRFKFSSEKCGGLL
jgi:predicted glycosyltransferase